MVLRLYDGSVLPTKGVITTQVVQDSLTITGSFVIVQNVDNQLPLLGRDWLYHLRLDWPKLFQSCNYSDRQVVYYIDDILVTGQTRQEHEENLRKVFQRLQQFGLKINLEKYQFFKESVDYLGPVKD